MLLHLMHKNRSTPGMWLTLF